MAHLEAVRCGYLPARQRFGGLTSHHRRTRHGSVAAMHRIDESFGSVETRTWSPQRCRAGSAGREMAHSPGSIGLDGMPGGHGGHGRIALAPPDMATEPPKRVPSGPECQFCDISSAECPERVENGDRTSDSITDDF